MRGWMNFLVGCLAILFAAGIPCKAGLRTPGKYCGTVIFDRWDGCILYDGVYVMYVSEKTKEGLRTYADQAIQIEAKEVYQPINPGDGRIGKLEYLGAASEKPNGATLEGIRLETTLIVNENGKPVATITIENKGEEPVKMYRQELALTLLTKRDQSQSWSVSDGPSFALIIRQSFEIGGSSPRWQGKGVAGGKAYSWTIGKENALPHDFTLAPNEKKQIDIHFDLPDGEYDFLCGYGYGGGVHASKGLTSNLSAFDVKDTKAKLVEIKGREQTLPTNADEP